MSTAHSKPSRSRKPNRSGQNDPSHGNDAGGHNGGRQAPKARQKGGAKGGSRGGSKGAPGLWLFGKHAVMAALANRERTIHRLVVAPDIAEALSAPGALREGCPKPEPQPRDRINALLSADALHQGFAAQVAPLEPPHLDQVAHDAPEDAVFMLLDGITDERNVGAILRSAAAFSVSGVIVQDRRAPEESGPLAKTACGALETVPLIRVPNLSRALEDMQKLGYWCLGLDGDG
ncbi:MAG: TrmH family RNA methyltransferase, partial [Rhodospirillaceae bacterium]